MSRARRAHLARLERIARHPLLSRRLGWRPADYLPRIPPIASVSLRMKTLVSPK